MATPAWSLSGQYYETCSCDFLCPCVPSQMAGAPTHGWCTFAMAFRIDRGRYGDVVLDGLGFIVLARTPEAMNKGNWSVGLVIDDRATTDQRDAITAVASGAAGGPMAGLAGLIGQFLGVERASIKFDRAGAQWSVAAADKIDMSAQAAMGINPGNSEPLKLSNTGHPASDSIILDHALKSHVNALGLEWDDVSGRNNGQHSPFSWRSA